MKNSIESKHQDGARSILGAFILLTAMGIASLSGCASRQEFRSKATRATTSHAETWANMLASQQIIPCYPLASDVRPGDAYEIGDMFARSIGKLGQADQSWSMRSTAFNVLTGTDGQSDADCVFPAMQYTVSRGTEGSVVVPFGAPLLLDFAAHNADEAEVIVQIKEGRVRRMSEFDILTAAREWFQKHPAKKYSNLAFSMNSGYELLTEVYYARGLKVRTRYKSEDGATAKASGKIESEPFGIGGSNRNSEEWTVQLEQDFSVPMAIGYRAVAVFVDGTSITKAWVATRPAEAISTLIQADMGLINDLVLLSDVLVRRGDTGVAVLHAESLDLNAACGARFGEYVRNEVPPSLALIRSIIEHYETNGALSNTTLRECRQRLTDVRDRLSWLVVQDSVSELEAKHANALAEWRKCYDELSVEAVFGETYNSHKIPNWVPVQRTLSIPLGKPNLKAKE